MSISAPTRSGSPSGGARRPSARSCGGGTPCPRSPTCSATERRKVRMMVHQRRPALTQGRRVAPHPARSGSTSTSTRARGRGGRPRDRGREPTGQRGGVDLPVPERLRGARVDRDAQGPPAAQDRLRKDPAGGPRQVAPPPRAGAAGTDGAGLPAPAGLPRAVAGGDGAADPVAGHHLELRDVLAAVHRPGPRRPQARQADGPRRPGVGEHAAGPLPVLLPGQGCRAARAAVLRARCLLPRGRLGLDGPPGVAGAARCADPGDARGADLPQRGRAGAGADAPAEEAGGVDRR